MSKFLTYEDRLVIAQLLQENASFGVIGKKLGKDRTTIAKEIKRHSYDKKSGRPGYPYNPCKHRSTCKAKKLCGNSCTHQSAYKCSLCSERTLYIVRILQRISAPLKQNLHMYVMVAASFPNVPYSRVSYSKSYVRRYRYQICAEHN